MIKIDELINLEKLSILPRGNINNQNYTENAKIYIN